MLINKQKEIQDVLLELDSVQAQGDKMVFTHQFDANPYLQNAHNIREWSDNGWTKDREQRQIASIPEEKFTELMLTNPEVVKDANALKRWIMSKEGEQYRTVKALDTGRSGKVIVK